MQARHISRFLIKFYSNIFHLNKLPSCRFIPTCSSYAEQVFRSYPAATAARLTIKRILRCHPFGPCGVDPAPSPTDYQRL